MMDRLIELFMGHHKIPVTRRLILSFMSLILIGSLLLSLPVMHRTGAPATNYLDHLFTAVSMVCVTGLSVFPVGQVYNIYGQLVSMLLMQFGGLSLVTLIAVSYYLLRRKMSLNDQFLLQSAIARDSSSDLKDYLFSIYKITFSIEGLGAILLMIDFIPRFGWTRGIFNSLFLTVSAFCNAGFDNLGSNSLMDFRLNPLVNFTVTFLIISGGLGFSVWQDLIKAAKQSWTSKPKQLRIIPQKLSHHSLLVLQTSFLILLLGTCLAWLLEFSNGKSIGHFNLFQQGMISFFQSVTMRTAGFSTLDYTQTHLSTNLLYILQMLIGGAPGGTAGGFKVTVAAILFLLFRAEISGQSRVNYRYRTISTRIIRQTLIILVFFFLVLISGYLLLLEFEPKLNPFALFFEASSALATVGVSMNLTTQLSTAGRIIIMLLMFIGRVGPITVLLGLLQKKEKDIHYAETDIILG